MTWITRRGDRGEAMAISDLAVAVRGGFQPGDGGRRRR